MFSSRLRKSFISARENGYSNSSWRDAVLREKLLYSEDEIQMIDADDMMSAVELRMLK